MHNYIEYKNEIVPFDLHRYKEITQMIFNKNLEMIWQFLDIPNIQSITFFYPKPPRKDWRQHTTIIQVYLSGRFQSEPKLKVVPGTRKQILARNKTEMIIDNLIPMEYHVNFGCIIITKAHTLYNINAKRKKVVLLLESY